MVTHLIFINSFFEVELFFDDSQMHLKQKKTFHNLVWSWGCYPFSVSWIRIAWQSRSLSRFEIRFFFFLHTKVKEPSLPYYLPIAGGRIFGFIRFTEILVLWEMQTASFWIWTRVANSPYYEGNRYVTSTSNVLASFLICFTIIFIFYHFGLCSQ